MPHVTVNDCDYFYTTAGDGPETIFFAHGFLMTHRMWAHQMEAFADDYRCIAIDWRGQGQSEVTEDGYSVPELADDTVALFDALAIDRCHYVGLSMGGFVGFHLLVDHADRLHSAALLETQAGSEETMRRIQYQAMLRLVKTVGYGPVIDRVMPILFGETFCAEQPEALEEWKDIVRANDRQGVYRAGQGIFTRENLLPRLDEVTTPTLIVVGEEDVATPPAKAEQAHAAIPTSELVRLPKAGHSSAIERPEAVTETLRTFIGAHAAVDASDEATA
ncbi:alpha/beta fold hydrolase [Salisaeta longa]|uniref:alpha/beta fold hydrolase n=1 Tax=Salisaeta longa TaxID=503170 RepID=UPI0003B4B785|nr:alpha/beta fold hydrolase [Salisaeta longa]